MDIVDRLGELVVDAIDEIEKLREERSRLRETLRLIAEHPVEQSQQWETAAKEMIRLAIAATKDVK